MNRLDEEVSLLTDASAIVVTVVLATLKFAGTIDADWGLVLSPLWALFLVSFWVRLGVFVVKEF